MGIEIETIVNEEKSAGSYKVEFYASELPSGIYFLRFNSENYIGLVKIVLVK